MTAGYVMSMPKKWKSTCTLFKSIEKEAKEDDLEDVRNSLPTHVIKEMIRTKLNMRGVIEDLKLSMSVQSLYGATSISVGSKNKNMININATSVSGRLAADISNSLAKVFLKNYEDMRNSSVSKRHEYFSKHKKKVMGDIADLETEKHAYLKKHNVSAFSLEGAKDSKWLEILDTRTINAEAQKRDLLINIKEFKDAIKLLPAEVSFSYEVTTVDDTKIIEKKK